LSNFVGYASFGIAVKLNSIEKHDANNNCSVKQGIQLAKQAQHLIQGGFSFGKVQAAQQLLAGAQSFYNSLKHMDEPQQEGLDEEEFGEDWKGEHKRVIMYSGCRDDQTSADATIGGGHVGAMSWAFLETMREYGNQTYIQVLQNTRGLLRQRYTQIPQLSVGDLMDLNQPFYV
jgi:hypothetical protein